MPAWAIATAPEVCYSSATPTLKAVGCLVMREPPPMRVPPIAGNVCAPIPPGPLSGGKGERVGLQQRAVTPTMWAGGDPAASACNCTR